MVQLSRLIFSLSLLAAAVATPVKRTVAQIEADIANIASQVATLDNDIKAFQIEADIANISFQVATLDNDIRAFPGSGLVDALVLGVQLLRWVCIPLTCCFTGDSFCYGDLTKHFKHGHVRCQGEIILPFDQHLDFAKGDSTC
jgi:hypothetical protein